MIRLDSVFVGRLGSVFVGRLGSVFVGRLGSVFVGRLGVLDAGTGRLCVGVAAGVLVAGILAVAGFVVVFVIVFLLVVAFSNSLYMLPVLDVVGGVGVDTGAGFGVCVLDIVGVGVGVGVGVLGVVLPTLFRLSSSILLNSCCKFTTSFSLLFLSLLSLPSGLCSLIILL